MREEVEALNREAEGAGVEGLRVGARVGGQVVAPCA